MVFHYPERMTDSRSVCKECGWKGSGEEVLEAANPFDANDTISGCPKCKSAQTMRTTCDEPGCWEPDTCGTPTPNGYRRTCGKHVP